MYSNSDNSKEKKTNSAGNYIACALFPKLRKRTNYNVIQLEGEST